MRTTPRSRWLVLLVLAGLLGCRGSVATTMDGGPNRGDDADTTFPQALKLLKWNGNEPPNYAEALTLLSTHVKRLADANPDVAARLQLSAGERSLLRDRWKLKDDELAELEGMTYTPLDTAHVEFCFLLRDAARVTQQNVPGATRRELARWAFDWVAREVRLQEEKRAALPPEYVLHRGHGTAMERALVFLALLQQHDIDGCLVGCRDDKNNLFLWAAGALVEDKGKKTREILLFDPRLGVPVPGPGGVATLDEIRTQPKLLPVIPADGGSAYRATPEQAAKAEVFVAPPLSALSPRMRFLEGLLADFDRVRLASDPEKLLARLGPEKAGVWDAGAADAPARLLRNFLPPTEGGTDKSGRALWYRRKAVPWWSIRQSFPAMPNAEAEAQIARVVALLYQTYDIRTRELLIRGKFEEVTRRLVRLHDEYQAERETFRDPGRVQKLRQEWVEQVRGAHVALAAAKVRVLENPQSVDALTERKRAEEKVAALLDDPYLVSVALGENEEGLIKTNDINAAKRDRPRRGLLTSVVMQSTLGGLGAEGAYLQALTRHERAALAQGRREHQPKDRTAASAAARAWQNTQKGWEAYLAEFPFTPATVNTRLFFITRLDKANELYLRTVVSLLEDLFQDLAMEGQARLLRARALERAGDVKAARELLAQLPAEFTELEKALEKLEGGGFQELRQRWLTPPLAQMEQQFARAGPKAEPPPYLVDLRHLDRDLAALERGAWRDTVRWLRASARARLARLPDDKR